jgi:hypothetical protein
MRELVRNTCQAEIYIKKNFKHIIWYLWPGHVNDDVSLIIAQFYAPTNNKLLYCRRNLAWLLQAFSRRFVHLVWKLSSISVLSELRWRFEDLKYKRWWVCLQLQEVIIYLFFIFIALQRMIVAMYVPFPFFKTNDLNDTF